MNIRCMAGAVLFHNQNITIFWETCVFFILKVLIFKPVSGYLRRWTIHRNTFTSLHPVKAQLQPMPHLNFHLLPSVRNKYKQRAFSIYLMILFFFLLVKYRPERELCLLVCVYFNGGKQKCCCYRQLLQPWYCLSSSSSPISGLFYIHLTIIEFLFSIRRTVKFIS